jgi:threonine/homoserine/homoserine lactone efflux protein
VDSILPALASGLLCGFVACVGVGPVNLTVVEQGMRRGFRGAFMAGFGAITAETFYATLALAGHAHLVPNKPTAHLIIRFVCAAVVAILGMRYLLIRPQEERLLRIAHRVDERWHHPRAWLLGFLVTITNLTLLLVWATLAAMLYTHDWVHPVFHSRAICASGVFLGGLIWYTIVATFVSRAHRVISIQQMTVLQRICGVIFLGFAVYLVYRVFVP